MTRALYRGPGLRATSQTFTAAGRMPVPAKDQAPEEWRVCARANVVTHTKEGCWL
jgi:hypothetical protein